MNTKSGSTGERLFVRFRLLDRAYAMAVEQIREIIYSRPATPVPGAPPLVLGVIDLRGQILPLLSLTRRLGLDGGDRTGAGVGHGLSQALIVQVGDRLAGLEVDTVHDVIRLPIESIAPPDPIGCPGHQKYIEGIFNSNDQLTLILDLNRILSTDDLPVVDQQVDAASGK